MSPKKKILLLLLCISIFARAFSLGNIELNSHVPDPSPDRNGKVLSLFSIVTFKNDGCRSTSGTTATSGINRNGTCYTLTECTDKGGTAAGNCAAGFGVCCLFILSESGTTVTENCTYIQNPGFPSALSATSAVSYTVAKCSPDVCMMRLDFETLTLLGPANTAEPDDGHNCLDTFLVEGSSGLSSPVICGVNSGQHLYMDLGTTATGTGTIQFGFTGSSTIRMWEIKVTQIPCNSPSRPFDPSCLQYHEGLTGRIQTFNFDASSGQQMHLASQRYSVCIRPHEGYCCVQYTLCTDTRSWGIDNTAMAKADENCVEDYVEISGVGDSCLQGNTGYLHSRLCGINFNTVDATEKDATSVCDCTKPFTVDFVTDATLDVAPAAGTEQRGVCFNYQQVACSRNTA